MIKVNLAPPTTKRPRRATASGPELNLGLLFGGILAALVLIIGGWWLAMSLEQRRLSAENDNHKRELARLQPIIPAGQRYRPAPGRGEEAHHATPSRAPPHRPP